MYRDLVAAIHDDVSEKPNRILKAVLQSKESSFFIATAYSLYPTACSKSIDLFIKIIYI